MRNREIFKISLILTGLSVAFVALAISFEIAPQPEPTVENISLSLEGDLATISAKVTDVSGVYTVGAIVKDSQGNEIITVILDREPNDIFKQTIDSTDYPGGEYTVDIYALDWLAYREDLPSVESFEAWGQLLNPTIFHKIDQMGNQDGVLNMADYTSGSQTVEGWLESYAQENIIQKTISRYQGTTTQPIDYFCSDVNQDGNINALDITFFEIQQTKPYNLRYDLDMDGDLDESDLSIIIYDIAHGKTVSDILACIPKDYLLDEAISQKIYAPIYAPGELIVKYQPYLGAQASALISANIRFSTVTGSSDSDNLHIQYQLESAERLFPDLEQKLEINTFEEMFLRTSQEFSLRTERAIQPASISGLDKGLDNIYLLKFSEEADMEEIAKQYSQPSEVVYAHPNYYMKSSSIPNDPYYSSYGTWGQNYLDMWGLDKIDTEHAWDTEEGNENIIVAVSDTGIDYNHEDIGENIWINGNEIPNDGIDNDQNGFIDDVRGWDFVNNDSDPMDDHGHGTHVAGTIAAVTNNSIGISGISWRSKVMAIKSLNAGGGGSIADLSKGIKYAADNGADIISMSWGGPSGLISLEDTLQYAYNLGCVLVAAATNESSDAGFYSPASSPYVLTIGASTPEDELTWFSNRGIKIDAVAPGWDVLSLRAAGTDMYGDGKHIVDEKYYRANGTSMAAPHVAGVAALILSHHPAFSNEEIRQVIRISADDIDQTGWDENTGYGRVNSFSALQETSACAAKIFSPYIHTVVGAEGYVNIEGSAFCPSGFKYYKVEYRKGEESQWTILKESSSQVNKGTLVSNWDISSLPAEKYTIKLTVIDQNNRLFTDRTAISKLLSSQFEVRIGPEVYAVNLDDINENGTQELLVATWYKVYVFDSLGNELVEINLPENEVPAAYAGLISSADLDPAYPGKELIFITTIIGPNGITTDQGKIHIFHADGTEIISGFWPKEVPRYDGHTLASSPVVADLNQDGKFEIIRAEANKLNIWDSQGEEFPGWPKYISEGENLSVGNIDDDPELEIIVGDIKSYRSWLYVFDWEGNVESGWPLDMKNASPINTSLGDIDWDGKNEIIVVSYDYKRDSKTKTIFVYEGNGQPFPGNWPQQIGRSNMVPWSDPVIGDLDRDWMVEIVVTSDSYIYVFNSEGSLKWSQEIGYPLAGPVLGDIDGDGRFEVFVSTLYSLLYGWHSDGQKVKAMPLQLGVGYNFSSPAVGDLDADGDLEIIAITSNMSGTTIRAFDTDFSTRPSSWPVYRASPQHTGLAYIPFIKAPCDSYGDLNNDGFLTDDDLTLIQNCVAGLSTCTSEQKLRADVNGDGKTNALDITQFERYIGGLDTTFPACPIASLPAPNFFATIVKGFLNFVDSLKGYIFKK